LPQAPEFDRLSVVLVATRNPLNIGAAARAMSNFGFSDLRLVNPYEPSFREARSAVNAAEVLASAELFNNVAEALADCSLVVGTTAARNRELHQQLHNLGEGAALVRRHLELGRAALLFGSEKTGLSNHDLSHCHWLLHIPTRDQHVSMNLGQAVAVCLYELARELEIPPAASQPSPELATAEDLERLSQLLLESLTVSEYAKAGMEASLEEKLRRLVHRLNLNPSDADLLLGMLRQILWKLRR
jgi:TrmH family RNA methyltransferase